MTGAFAAGVGGGTFVGRTVGGWLPGWLVFAIVGLPGGACLTSGCAGGAFAGRKFWTSVFASGSPGWAASDCCCFSNGTGGGGGGVLATTVRAATAAGGWATGAPVLAEVPRTLLLVGTYAALELTGAEAICCASTLTAALATG